MDERHYRNCVVSIAVVLVLVLAYILTQHTQPTPETMSNSHWVQRGGYSHTGSTLPTFGYSGYYGRVPTPPMA